MQYIFRNTSENTSLLLHLVLGFSCYFSLLLLCSLFEEELVESWRVPHYWGNILKDSAKHASSFNFCFLVIFVPCISFILHNSLRPSEVLSVLPPNLIYLGGDGMLRENFHVLCNHGIPRGKIEKDV